jgi:hypothetical protein
VNDSFRFNKPLPSTKSSEELNSALEDKIEDLQYFPMKNMTYDSLLIQITSRVMDLNQEKDTLILSIFTHGEIDFIIDINDRNFAYSDIYDAIKIKIPKNLIIINDACYGVSCFSAFKTGIIFANKTKGYTSLDLGFFMTMYITYWLENSDEIDWFKCFKYVQEKITLMGKVQKFDQTVEVRSKIINKLF